MQTCTLAVEGMTCDGCVGSVTAALKAVPGVSKVKVSLKDKQATVSAAASDISPKALEEAVEKAGYKARLIAQPEANGPGK